MNPTTATINPSHRRAMMAAIASSMVTGKG
jgi:hypothetical protein